MKIRTTTIAAVFCFFVLYAPQPLLPIFAKNYAISTASAGALMTATLIPLAVAPLLYGYVLVRIAATTLLRLAVLALAISCIAFAQSNSYHFALAVRLAQGMVLPAALTSITTYISIHSTPQCLQKNMSWFITGTILGGFLGRLLSGLFASYWSWQLFYYLLSVALCVVAFCIPKKTVKVQSQQIPLHIAGISHVIGNTHVLKIYLAIFCLFFSFVAVLNYLPFMVQTILGSNNSVLLGLIYFGFLMGVATSLNAQRLVVFFHSAKTTMLVGFGCFLVSIVLLLIQKIALIFCVLFVFCGAMFLVHSVAAAEVNRHSTDNKSIVNALYMSFYYGGGVLGSYFPGVLYQNFGSTVFLLVLFCVSMIGCISLMRLGTAYVKTP